MMHHLSTVHHLAAAPDVAFPGWIILFAGAAGAFLGAALTYLVQLSWDKKDRDRFWWSIFAVVGAVVGLGLGIFLSVVNYNATVDQARAGWSKQAATYLSEKYVTPIAPADALELARGNTITAVVRGEVADVQLTKVSGEQAILVVVRTFETPVEVPHRKGR